MPVRNRARARPGLRLGLGLVTALCGLSSQPALAQPFADAATATVNYSEGTIAPGLACADVSGLVLPDLLSISARVIPADGAVPEHCRVDGVLDPAITFQVNLPSRWNSRFYMVGNGGAAGQQPDSQAAARSSALSHHFVMAATDTGHDSSKEPGYTFILSDPRKATDYAFRAVHLTAVTSKAIAQQYYGQATSYSYWNSCSNGGRQGLLEAQRYPTDFDGIVANAPWVDQTGFAIGAIWNQQAVAGMGITPGKLDTLATTVLNKCDALDGLRDGLIDDPRMCSVDVATEVPSCAAGNDSDACLTPAQAEAIQKVYDGPRDSAGNQLFPGFMFGSEQPVRRGNGPATSAWMNSIVPASADAKPGDFNLAEGIMRYMVFSPPRPDWDYRDFDFDRDPELVDRWSRLADAKDIDLWAFHDNGGKLLMTYGWADQVLQPLMGVNYFERVLQANAPAAESFTRLFMLPGMIHCAGGVGPDQYDAVTAVIDWVEGNQAPDRLIARKLDNGQTTRSRPLCPYPQVARYTGQGSTDDAANFQCREP